VPAVLAGTVALTGLPAWVSPRLQRLDVAPGLPRGGLRGHVAMCNWLDILEEAVGVPTPQAPKSPMAALDTSLVAGEVKAYLLEEKGLSMSGEDFEVKSPTGEILLKIGGGNRIPIPGMPVWDKLTVSTPGGKAISILDREAMAMTTTYNLNRADGSKFGKISKAMFAFTQTFELWKEGESEPLLKAEGSFSDRNYVMKCKDGTVVATVTRLKGFSANNVDNYNVIVGPTVDASLVLAMAVVIDEVHDEENKVEGEGEPLPEMLEDARGMEMPKAASPPIPSGVAPLDAELVHASTTAYELEEKGLSMGGEDFEVKSPTGQLILKIGGGNRIPLPAGMPVWDKMTVNAASGAQIMTLDREMIAMTPTYDVYRANGQKFGKVSKAMFGLFETFEFFLEGEGDAVLKAEGSFSERKYTFKSREGTVVATCGKGYFQTDNENRYHLVVGANVDASMVLAMAMIIDEVHDEEEAAKEAKGEEGGWPFR